MTCLMIEITSVTTKNYSPTAIDKKKQNWKNGDSGLNRGYTRSMKKAVLVRSAPMT